MQSFFWIWRVEVRMNTAAADDQQLMLCCVAGSRSVSPAPAVANVVPNKRLFQFSIKRILSATVTGASAVTVTC